MRNNVASVSSGWSHPPSRLSLRWTWRWGGTQPAVSYSRVQSATRSELVNTTCATREALPATPDAVTDCPTLDVRSGTSDRSYGLRSTCVNNDSRS